MIKYIKSTVHIYYITKVVLNYIYLIVGVFDEAVFQCVSFDTSTNIFEEQNNFRILIEGIENFEVGLFEE